MHRQVAGLDKEAVGEHARRPTEHQLRNESERSPGVRRPRAREPPVTVRSSNSATAGIRQACSKVRRLPAPGSGSPARRSTTRGGGFRSPLKEELGTPCVANQLGRRPPHACSTDQRRTAMMASTRHGLIMGGAGVDPPRKTADGGDGGRGRRTMVGRWVLAFAVRGRQLRPDAAGRFPASDSWLPRRRSPFGNPTLGRPRGGGRGGRSPPFT